MEPWWNPGGTLVEPWWNPGGTLVEPWWNLTSGPPRTTPEPIWAETPKLPAVGEKERDRVSQAPPPTSRHHATTTRQDPMNSLALDGRKDARFGHPLPRAWQKQLAVSCESESHRSPFSGLAVRRCSVLQTSMPQPHIPDLAVLFPSDAKQLPKGCLHCKRIGQLVVPFPSTQNPQGHQPEEPLERC